MDRGACGEAEEPSASHSARYLARLSSMGEERVLGGRSSDNPCDGNDEGRGGPEERDERDDRTRCKSSSTLALSPIQGRASVLERARVGEVKYR